MAVDGLNSTKYKVLQRSQLPTCTNITVDVGTAIVTCKPLLYRWACKLVTLACKLTDHFGCGYLQYNSTDEGTLDWKELQKLSPATTGKV